MFRRQILKFVGNEIEGSLKLLSVDETDDYFILFNFTLELFYGDDSGMSFFASRLKSFQNGQWPINTSTIANKLDPYSMVNAGLYYTGCSDIVKCFSCQNSFKEWEPNDDPFTEHRRLTIGTCAYIQLLRYIKGEMNKSEKQRLLRHAEGNVRYLSNLCNSEMNSIFHFVSTLGHDKNLLTCLTAKKVYSSRFCRVSPHACFNKNVCVFL